MELDATTLAQIRKLGGDALLGRLAELFLENTPARMEEIRRGLAGGDWPRTALALHSLRSSSVTLGATELADQAAALERLAAEKEREKLEAAMSGLEERSREALVSIKDLVEG